MHRIHKEFAQAIQKAGIEIEEIRNGKGSHLIFYVSYRGHKGVLIAGRGATDYRSQKNSESDVRRFVKEAERALNIAERALNIAERKSPSNPSP
jgi:hypothetical protein